MSNCYFNYSKMEADKIGNLSKTQWTGTECNINIAISTIITSLLFMSFMSLE